MDSSGGFKSTRDSLHLLDHSSGSSHADLSGLYHLGRTLGRGHFAVVKLARHIITGQLVAIKIIDKTKLDVLATSHLLQEVRCMKLVQHPNVVHLYEVINTPTTLYLVMELAEGGDLYDYILRHEGGVAEHTAKRHFAQIVRAVAYCHRLHVVHRDLKPENVVFFPQQGAVKLTDFGFSNLFQPGSMLATSCGSLAYSAPEILLGEEYDAPAVDIWSLGVILYMLVCGVPPFQETNDSETLVMILDCRYSVPEHVSDGCRDLISRMLQKDPSHRASLEEIDAHNWLQGLDNPLLSPEAPPNWLSGALSPCSTRPGRPECGDLLAAKPLPHQVFPGPRQPCFSLHPPPADEPPTTKTLVALQHICEEEEDDDDEEEEEEGEGVDEQSSPTKGSEEDLTSRPLLLKEWCRHLSGPGGRDIFVALQGEPEGQDGEEGNAGKEGLQMESCGDEVEMEEEEMIGTAETEMELEREENGRLLSDQLVRGGDERVCEMSEIPPPSQPAFMNVQCCQGQANALSSNVAKDGEAEPNNNVNKPSSDSPLPPVSSSPPLTARHNLTGLEAQRTEREGRAGERRGEGETDRSQSRNASGSREAGPDAAAKVEPGKGRSVKLRERLFQFPLCEKALSFNLPTHNKTKILPLTQYNCCHVL
ncbi:SNF related kinase b [Lampris incognitus]|uniref:SNF related kinase b n=1 Tax=Lampris incognitus TaxID=2546036 RepID=UPI0024B5EFDB|nr:SNF related kinase b [Lampris incognitus]